MSATTRALTDFDTALTTSAAAKIYLGITGSGDDTLIAAMVSDASAWISQWCGRKFATGTVTNEIHDGRGTPQIWLRRWPITSITSLYLDAAGDWDSGSLLVEDTSSVDGDYRVALGGAEEGQGRIDRLGSDWPRGPGWIKVTYVGGYSTIPTAVALAAKLLIAHMYTLQKSGVFGQLSTQSLPAGGGSQAYHGLTMPPAIAEMLAPWRREAQW